MVKNGAGTILERLVELEVSSEEKVGWSDCVIQVEANELFVELCMKLILLRKLCRA